MIEMTLSSRHRIRNSSPDGLRPSTLPLSNRGGPRVVVSTAAFHARVRGSVPGLGGLKETKLFLPHPRVKVSIVGSLRDREVACSAYTKHTCAELRQYTFVIILYYIY